MKSIYNTPLTPLKRGMDCEMSSPKIGLHEM
jgi:hypothetical protein